MSSQQEERRLQSTLLYTNLKAFRKRCNGLPRQEQLIMQRIVVLLPNIPLEEKGEVIEFIHELKAKYLLSE